MFYTKFWDEFTFSSKVMNGIFQYLNRHYVQRETRENIRCHEVYQQCIVLWREHFYKHLKEPMRIAILELIEMRRNGVLINSNLLQQVTNDYILKICYYYYIY